MTARRISTKTPNQTVAQPATVPACRQDRGTPQDRAARAEDAVAQSETTKWNAKAGAERWGGVR